MIGNAVPVKQAEYVARCIRACFEKGEDVLKGMHQKAAQLSLFEVGEGMLAGDRPPRYG